ncbi:porin [Pigmentiphaga litoralis]|uniref:porin n=1 Tax=Pigmentiphaga litoralis TaxID=516702 RepID=UPI00167B8B1C|nr:porin [Pigmentiphaga litoralis]GGX01151.1 porin [Pigmentiphaga litoralis]
MKKTLLAAALLAGFAGAANAQSNVTLYGIADIGFQNEKTEGQSSRSALDSGLGAQSRWGIRGSEDIGNGLKAIFQLESGFQLDDGASTQGRLFGRYAFVGLESARAGRLTLGRTTNLGFMWAAGIVNPFGLSYSRSAVSTTFGYNTGDFGAGSRVNNSAYYYSPVIAGFQGAVGYSFQTGTAGAEQEVAGNGNNNRMLDVGLKYENGPLKGVATYSYANLSGPLEAANGGEKPQNLIVGASYDFGVVAAYAGWSHMKNPLNNVGANLVTSGVPSAANQFANLYGNDNAYTLGLSAPLGAGKVMAAYQYTTKSEIDGYSVGYVYDLSKRTNVYVFFNDYDQRQFRSRTDYSDLSKRQLAFGLQHKF